MVQRLQLQEAGVCVMWETEQNYAVLTAKLNSIYRNMCVTYFFNCDFGCKYFAICAYKSMSNIAVLHPFLLDNLGLPTGVSSKKILQIEPQELYTHTVGNFLELSLFPPVLLRNPFQLILFYSLGFISQALKFHFTSEQWSHQCREHIKSLSIDT